MIPFAIFLWVLSGWTACVHSKPLGVLKSNDIDHPFVFDGGSDDHNETDPPNCRMEPLDLKDVDFLKNGYMLVRSYNATIPVTHSEIRNEEFHVCFNRSAALKKEILRKCEKWLYKEDEYTVTKNGTVYLYSDVLEPGTYEIKDGELITCATANEDYDNSEFTAGTSSGVDQETAAIYIGKIGSSVSILALLAHLATFCLIPSLRNLPGYNLASLSVAFLLGNCFYLIGQIPEVLDLPCIISGVLQQNFFLAAFFCMNVMAFDVWRTLKLATSKLILSSQHKKMKFFMMYCAYCWGTPLVITTVSVLMDNVQGVPEWVQPMYGREETCYMTNVIAKYIFFSVPVFTLIVINGVLFVLSALMINDNKMKSTNDQHKQTTKLNFVLYVRLALMMGLTWLIGIVAAATGNRTIWFIFDVFNSLQGLLVFLLFTCSKKNFLLLKEKVGLRMHKISASENKTPSTTKSETQ